MAPNFSTTQASSPDNKPRLRDTTMTYDVLGRKTGMSDADMGAWVYSYDAPGNLIRQQAPGNVALCFYYDDFNRPTGRINDATPGDGCPAAPPTPDTNHLASYTYGTSPTEHNVGRVTQVSWGPNPAANGDLFYYDDQGRLTWQYRQVGGQMFNYGLADYDVLDRPQTILLPSGESVTVGYDKEGENSLTAGSTTLIDAVGYNERGQLALLSRVNGAPDTTLSYHGAVDNFRLNKILHGPEGGVLPDFIYGATQYDDDGNLLGMQMKLNGATDSLSYSYDEMNRLKTAALTGAGAANYSYTYAYDRLGNILSRTGTDPDMTYTYGTPSGTPAVTGGPQAVTRVDNSVGSDWSYDYDARGNLDGKYEGSILTYDYTFDAENRLASVRTNNQTTTFAYDADGQRVMTTRPDGTVIYTPFPDYEREVAPGGAVTERTTYRIAGRIVAVRSAGEYSYTYGDHLGNVVGLSNLNGGFNTNSVARYDPFGNFRTTPTTNPGVTSRGFTGHVHNNTGTYPTQNVGLIYMNARYYLPEVGRFISADTIVPEPENPQGYNRYSYALNIPLKYTDPSGHAICSPETIFCQNPISFTPIELGTTGNRAIDWVRNTIIDFACGFVGSFCEVEHNQIVPTDDAEYLEAKRAEIIAFAMPLRVPSGAGEALGRINPFKVRFSQDSIRYQFKDGTTIDELASGLRQGTIEAADVPPIRLLKREDLLYTLDNRRLEAFRRAEIDVPYRMATSDEVASEVYKFTTKNQGVSIRIRNEPR